MRKPLLRAIVATLAVAAYLTVAPEPATATTVVGSRFYGYMEIPYGLGDPCTPIGTTDNCRLPLIDGVYAGTTSNFAFSSVVCVAAGLDVDEDALPVVGPLCAITASGVITGFCGSASATGSGNATFWLPSADTTTADTFNFTWRLEWAGTQYTHNAMVLTGTITHVDGGPSGSITGRMAIQPDPMYGSCTNGTATRWIVEADTAIEIVTV